MKSKQELKAAYRNIQQRYGVFQIRNTVNGKIYVEASVNLDKIWNRHRVELQFNGHRNETLQKEWNAFGEAAFVFEVLSEIKQEDNSTRDYGREAKQLARMFIDELQPFGEKGYN